MVEIWCNGKLHYTRPSMDDKDVQECLALIKWHKLLAGGISSYEVREILSNTFAPDGLSEEQKMVASLPPIPKSLPCKWQ